MNRNEARNAAQGLIDYVNQFTDFFSFYFGDDENTGVGLDRACVIEVGEYHKFRVDGTPGTFTLQEDTKEDITIGQLEDEIQFKESIIDQLREENAKLRASLIATQEPKWRG